VLASQHPWPERSGIAALGRSVCLAVRIVGLNGAPAAVSTRPC